MPTLYFFDDSGAYASRAYQETPFAAVPAGATMVAPAFAPGFLPVWDGEAWRNVEDHRGERGWVDGAFTIVSGIGPLPAGWEQAPPTPAGNALTTSRRAEILARLAELAAASIRPLRAIADGTAVQADRDRLTALDVEAAGLREDLREEQHE